jgi:hypothetical protein
VHALPTESLPLPPVPGEPRFPLVDRREDLDAGHELVPRRIPDFHMDKAKLDGTQGRDGERCLDRASAVRSRRRTLPRLRVLRSPARSEDLDIGIHDSDLELRGVVLHDVDFQPGDIAGTQERHQAPADLARQGPMHVRTQVALEIRVHSGER